MRSRVALVAVATLAFAVGLTACGQVNQPGPSATSSPTRSDADPVIAALVPDSVRADGKLTIAVDASYPPNEYTDSNGQITGWGVELATDVAHLMDLEPVFENVTFDQLITDVRDNTYELGLGSITITPSRTPLVDLVSYYQAGTAWAVAQGNPTGMTQNNACGRNVAVLRGSVQADDLAARSTLCTRASRSAIVIEPLEQQTDVTKALLDGTVDAMAADSPVVADAVAKSTGKIQMLGTTYAVAPYGIAVRKGAGNLAVAVRRAVQTLMDDGTYTGVLRTAGVQAGAIQTSLIYPPAR
jgi:polar amino acid transport system substrate-binding protein